ncbi:hypothetical protein GCM10017687_63950 [Streptomyces echinatus]
MGMAGTRFGRNIPLEAIAPAAPEDVLSAPSPREVSRTLLTPVTGSSRPNPSTPWSPPGSSS